MSGYTCLRPIYFTNARWPLNNFVLLVCSRVKRLLGFSLVRLTVQYIPIGRRLFAWQQVAERAGWPVTDGVHGAAVYRLFRPAVRGHRLWPAYLQGAPLLIARTGLRIFGHQQVWAL
ncbi:Uncharacterized protein FWK35_00000234 [Aphis craccivora]|uniref:Uncharacterized protein n=1 Tax=Aphis craccivora TaxID=307492 RepID=A0A6G0ZRA9_APHCR|nr:Uncharacterized protein FWK35_00000234 [Aphis craccivora]